MFIYKFLPPVLNTPSHFHLYLVFHEENPNLICLCKLVLKHTGRKLIHIIMPLLSVCAPHHKKDPLILCQKLQEPLSILMKYKATETLKTVNKFLLKFSICLHFRSFYCFQCIYLSQCINSYDKGSLTILLVIFFFRNSLFLWCINNKIFSQHNRITRKLCHCSAQYKILRYHVNSLLLF